MVCSEKLLHFIWRYKLLTPIELKTTEGDTLRILDFGQYNTNAGADFEFAKIQLNGSTWIGNIEIHIDADDWHTHAHELDLRHNATILHVVWNNKSKRTVQRQDGTVIPTLQLKEYVNPHILSKYQELMHTERWIACENHLRVVPKMQLLNWTDRLIVERLERRYQMVYDWLVQTKFDWEKVQLLALGRAFGMKVNSAAFEKLITNCPTNILFKNADDLFKIESILFGIAGFLRSHAGMDEYTVALAKEFEYQQKIHGLKVMSLTEWKFMRMRPYNFPTFRIAQFAGLLHKRIQWLEGSISGDLNDIFSSCRSVVLHPYWEHHFSLDKMAKPHHTSFTQEFIHHLLINAFVPVLFSYGKYMNEEKYQLKAIDWLSSIPAEKNNIISNYKSRGIASGNAQESQALLHLYKEFCLPKKCLDCTIGYAIIKRD